MDDQYTLLVTDHFPNCSAGQARIAADICRKHDIATARSALGNLAAGYVSLEIPALRRTLDNMCRPRGPDKLEAALAEVMPGRESAAARRAYMDAVEEALAPLRARPEEEEALYAVALASGLVNPLAERMVAAGRRPCDIWSVAQALCKLMGALPQDTPAAHTAPPPPPVYSPEVLPWEA